MAPSPDTRPMREQMEEYIRLLQEEIVGGFEKLDPASPPFKRDAWVRAQGGSGQSCVFATPDPSTGNASTTHISVLEKAGVNISIVHGTLPPAAIRQMRADHSSMPLPEDAPGGLPFFAAGLSLVVHPRNPHAPTVHANYRYFEIVEPEDKNNNGTQPKILAWWFGGGADLTPSYLYEEDAIHFHTVLKAACDAHGSSVYPMFKVWCDEYFYITHRKESRGIGGIFFDDLCDTPHKRFANDASRPKTPAEIFAMVKALGRSFVPSYLPILAKRYTIPYTPHQRRWQLVRRGRYVEFNLIYDRGTKFGLMTPGARVESILMSLPETVRWEYQSELGEDPNTEEGKLMAALTTTRDWVQ